LVRLELESGTLEVKVLAVVGFEKLEGLGVDVRV